MHRTPRRWHTLTLSLAGALALLLAPTLAAQSNVVVDPPGRQLLITSGKSASIKIDAGACSPSWTAVSDNTNAANVSPAQQPGGSKRNFKVQTPKGLISGQATVTITVMGVGAGCKETEVIEIDVFVVKDANAPKHYESGSKGAGITGIKKRLSELKKTSKNIEKGYKADTKTILKQYQTDSLPDQTGEGPGLPPAAWAQQMVSDCLDEALDQLEDAFVDFLEGSANDGYSIMSLYGFLDFVDQFLARDFQTGGCGAWDGAIEDGSSLVNDMTWRLDSVFKQTAGKIEKEADKRGTPFASNATATATEFPISNGGLSPDQSSANYDFAKGSKKFKFRKTEATNFVDDMGGNDHGHIYVKAKAPGSGSVTVTYERLDSSGNPVGMGAGDFFEETVSPSGPKCKFKSAAPDAATPGDLKPGQWRITMTQGSESESTTITVPTGTVGRD